MRTGTWVWPSEIRDGTLSLNGAWRSRPAVGTGSVEGRKGGGLDGSRTRRAALAATLVLLATLFPAAVAAGPAGCDVRSNNSLEKLLECMTLEGVESTRRLSGDRRREQRHASLARLAMTSRSITAVEVLEAAGYNVTRQSFDFVRFEVISPAILQQIEPGPVTDLPNIIMSYRGTAM